MVLSKPSVSLLDKEEKPKDEEKAKDEKRKDKKPKDKKKSDEEKEKVEEREWECSNGWCYDCVKVDGHLICYKNLDIEVVFPISKLEVGTVIPEGFGLASLCPRVYDGKSGSKVCLSDHSEVTDVEPLPKAFVNPIPAYNKRQAPKRNTPYCAVLNYDPKASDPASYLLCFDEEGVVSAVSKLPDVAGFNADTDVKVPRRVIRP
eukprot:Trichotokara_eunicae@DN5097_c0_g1_i3.p1